VRLADPALRSASTKISRSKKPTSARLTPVRGTEDAQSRRCLARGQHCLRPGR
jgi:hypothetical protein